MLKKNSNKQTNGEPQALRKRRTSQTNISKWKDNKDQGIN
jgi:hypothetical protein